MKAGPEHRRRRNPSIGPIKCATCADAGCRCNLAFAVRVFPPPPPAALPPKRWRDLILRVWHVDPLHCPVCNNPMRVIAVIDDPAVISKILRHLGLWHAPPQVRASSGQSGCALEPWLEDPMPDYENVLTD
jgi:hypothetical protein